MLWCEAPGCGGLFLIGREFLRRRNMRSASVMKASFILNVVLISIHEMQAMVWKEWRIFGFIDDTIGMNVFVCAHILLYIALFSAIVYAASKYGMVVSIVVSTFMPVHLVLHINAYHEGYFTDVLSFTVIISAAVVSAVQFSATVLCIRRGRNAG
jgi:hypothetical protein